MPGFPAPFIKFREDDANGLPLAGGLLYSYAAGTSTPLATYTTQDVSPVTGIPNANPTVLDASGRASVFIEDGVGYKFVLHDALGNVIWTVDNVQVPETSPAASSGGSSGVFVPAGTIVMWGGTLPPGPSSPPSSVEWLLCDGASKSAAEFPLLFNAIATNFGGAGASFNVPDLRQRFPLGKAVSGPASALNYQTGTYNHRHAGGSHTHAIAGHTHILPAHVHQVPHSGWPTAVHSPPDAGVLHAGYTGGASDATMSVTWGNRNTDPNTLEAFSGQTGGFITVAGGTELTDEQNPPLIVVNFIIRTGNPVP